MNQTNFDLRPFGAPGLPADATRWTNADHMPACVVLGTAADPGSRAGFQLGWDFARHGLVPDPELLSSGTPVCQGWLAGRAMSGRRTLAAPRAVRSWLVLRATAWRSAVPFDEVQVTPTLLTHLHSERCPVLRQALGGAPGSALAAVIERLQPQAGFVAGNLLTMSQAAADARAGLDLNDLLRRARQAEITGEPVAGLPAPAWWRLATLSGFGMPANALPFHVAARLPLAVLPPAGVRIHSAAQALQALVTQCFLRPGWAARARALAACLPAHSLRHDFNLFVGAMAPRVLEAGQDPATLRQALEDAWLQERVQRRWQHFVLALGERACDALLHHASQHAQTEGRTPPQAPALAVTGSILADTSAAEIAALQPPVLRAVLRAAKVRPRQRRTDVPAAARQAQSSDWPAAQDAAGTPLQSASAL